jgi:hypothetical protein
VTAGNGRLVGVVLLVVATATAAGGTSLWFNGLPRAREADPPVISTPAVAAPGNPGPAASSGLVRLEGGAAAAAGAAGVAALIERHFAAINARDYGGWAETVTPARSAALPPGRWQAQYRSTRDSSVDVIALSPYGNGVLVALTFVSEQDQQDAPADLRIGRICWRSSWPVVDGRIGVPPPGSTTRSAC